VVTLNYFGESEFSTSAQGETAISSQMRSCVWNYEAAVEFTCALAENL